MSKKKEYSQKPIEFSEVEKTLRAEAIKEEYNIDDWLRNYVNKTLLVKGVDFADRYVIIVVEYEGKTLRLASASRIISKKVRYLEKAIKMFGSIKIIPKLMKSKNGNEYLDI